MQLFGGRSFFATEPFERLMRDARINIIGEGSNEVLRVFIGAVGLRDIGMQLQSLLHAAKNPISGFGALCSLAGAVLRRTSKPAIPVRSPLLRNEAQRFSRSIRRFAFSILHLLAKYRETVVDEQLKLNRIAESAISLYTVSAVLSRIDQDILQAGDKGFQSSPDVALARFYCSYALDKLDNSLTHLFANNRDTEMQSLSDILTGDSIQ
jgi:acyl-CoA dehydrogenase family protein 9